MLKALYAIVMTIVSVFVCLILMGVLDSTSTLASDRTDFYTAHAYASPAAQNEARATANGNWTYEYSGVPSFVPHILDSVGRVFGNPVSLPGTSGECDGASCYMNDTSVWDFVSNIFN